MGRKRRELNDELWDQAEIWRIRRRTHQSGPLGELFDHGMSRRENDHTILTRKSGVDACNTVLEVLLFAAAVNLGQTWYTVLTLFGGE